MTLPPPATGVELYLAAIHEVLCDIRMAFVGGGQEPHAEVDPDLMLVPGSPRVTEQRQQSATKRTRARAPRTT